MTDWKLAAITNSALWAAYGDALGFITELTDVNGLKRRAHLEHVETTVEWRRLIGGKFGTLVNLPAGSYSDDTQLRLATCRATRGDGEFDVEAFAKVELPVWTSYALGAGRGTKTAASELSRRDVAWFSNFYDSPKGRYIDGGGNGAAMRIQPHIWAAQNTTRPESYLRDVIRNSICTHGHPRGFFGAAIYAVCLAETINHREIPRPDSWEDIIDRLEVVTDVIRDDPDLGAFWLPTWEELSNTKLEVALKRIRDEWVSDIRTVRAYINAEPVLAYEKLVNAVGGLSDQRRGCGTTSTLISLALSWMYRDVSPRVALETSANLLSSDTDTIATMAGALLGILSDEAPPDIIQDRAYLVSEAERLFDVSNQKLTKSFQYPDLLHWQPPRSQLDAVGLVDGKLALAGIGLCEPVGPEFDGADKSKAVWQWLKLPFGQTALCKRRKIAKPLSAENYPAVSTYQLPRASVTRPQQRMTKPQSLESDLFTNSNRIAASVMNSNITEQRTLDDMTTEAIKSGFDVATLGRHLIECTNHVNGIEMAIAYSSIIAKARIARNQADQKKKVG